LYPGRTGIAGTFMEYMNVNYENAQHYCVTVELDPKSTEESGFVPPVQIIPEVGEKNYIALKSLLLKY
jgi:hypothetical protein